MPLYKVYATVTFNLEYEIIAANEDKAFEVADNFLQKGVEEDLCGLRNHTVKTDYEVNAVNLMTEEDYECCCMKVGYAPCEDCS